MPRPKPLSDRIARNRGETPRYEAFYSQYDPPDLRRKRRVRVERDMSGIAVFCVALAVLSVELYVGLGRGAKWYLIVIGVIYGGTMFVAFTAEPYVYVKKGN